MSDTRSIFSLNSALRARANMLTSTLTTFSVTVWSNLASTEKTSSSSKTTSVLKFRMCITSDTTVLENQEKSLEAVKSRLTCKQFGQAAVRWKYQTTIWQEGNSVSSWFVSLDVNVRSEKIKKNKYLQILSDFCRPSKSGCSVLLLIVSTRAKCISNYMMWNTHTHSNKDFGFWSNV